MFRRKDASYNQPDEDLDDLEEEVRQLERTLKANQDELFHLQRNSYRRNLTPVKLKTEEFIRPEKIVLQNDIAHLERNLELMTWLSGMEVKSYIANEHCIIVYHMQHRSQHAVQHGLKINMTSGTNTVSKYSCPTGFNFNAVMEEFDNIMTPEALCSLRSALAAYYDRLEQFEALKKLLLIDMFKIMDGTHMDISFQVKSDIDDGEPIDVVLLLDYRMHDIRPKQISFNESVYKEGVSEALLEQCAVLKRKPLDEAFKECFLSDNWRFKFVHHYQPDTMKPVRAIRRAPRQPQWTRHDDTFVPEDCPESSEDEDERHLKNMYGRRK